MVRVAGYAARINRSMQRSQLTSGFELANVSSTTSNLLIFTPPRIGPNAFDLTASVPLFELNLLHYQKKGTSR